MTTQAKPGKGEYYELESSDPGKHYLEIKNGEDGKYKYNLIVDQNRTFLISSEKHVKEENAKLNDVLDVKLERLNIISPINEVIRSDPVPFDEDTYNTDSLTLAGWIIKGGFAYLDLNGQKKEVKILEEFYKTGLTVDSGFIDAYPSQVVIKQSPLTRKTEYLIRWISNRAKYPFETEGTPQSIINELKDQGYLLNSEKPVDKLSIMLKELHKCGVAESDYKIDVPGFFCLDNEIIPAKYDMTPPSEDEIFQALEMLERFAGYFGSEDLEIDQRAKIATVFKLSLTMPFNYVRKQLGYSEVIKPPMAYGKPGSGKTTINLLPAYMFDLDLDTFEGAGSNIQTVARFAELMGKTTFPTLIDEAWNVFDDKTMVEMNKTGLRRLYVRNKLTKDGRKIEEPAYSTFIYISNHPPIRDSMDGTVRRYHIISYDELEYKDEQDKRVKEFQQFFKLRDPDSPLTKLEAIGRFASNKVIKNPEILALDMLESGEQITKELYDFIGRQVPDWLTWKAETQNIEDFGMQENDIIKGFILETMLRAYDKKITIDDGSPYGRKDKDLTNYDDNETKEKIKDRLYQVGKERLISWIFYRDKKGVFIIKPHFVDELSRQKGLTLSLKTVSQKFQGWKYKNVRDEEQKQVRMIRISSKDFYAALIE